MFYGKAENGSIRCLFQGLDGEAGEIRSGAAVVLQAEVGYLLSFIVHQNREFQRSSYSILPKWQLQYDCQNSSKQGIFARPKDMLIRRMNGRLVSGSSLQRTNIGHVGVPTRKPLHHRLDPIQPDSQDPLNE